RAAQGNTYNVYRGSIAVTGLRGIYNHTCFESDSPDRSTTDASAPGSGLSFYYLVSAHNPCGESGPGTQSSGTPQPPGTSCTPTSLETDGDGVRDLDDNCAAASNATQADADGDGVGDACDDCPSTPNPTQTNSDTDTLGDACDNCP